MKSRYKTWCDRLNLSHLSNIEYNLLKMYCFYLGGKMLANIAALIESRIIYDQKV